MSDLEIYKYHGWREQNKQLNEETGELIEAIHDYQVIDSSNNLDHVTEEVADVLFMLEQIISAYDIDLDSIDNWLEFKRNRESNRIIEGYYE